MIKFARLQVWLWYLSAAFASLAQTNSAASAPTLTISSPPNRIVYQRNASNSASIQVSGNCPATATRIEVRLVPVSPAQGEAIGWTIVDQAPANGSFQGRLNAKGGWYTLELRALQNDSVVASASVQRVGIGEVFVVVGHSVACGGEINIEGATDDRVNTVPIDKKSQDYATYEKTGDPALLPNTFAHYGTGVIPAPFGCGNYFWSKFGERVAQKENVPVLIFNAAFGGTSLEHWFKSSQNIQFEHSFVRSRIRMPYINLHNTLKKYISTTGIRAILADQGQNDWPEKNADLVFSYYKGFIDQARKDLGYPKLAVVVNRQTPFLRDTAIRKAQEQMIQSPNCFAGPDYDKLAPEDRPDSIHLGPSGETKAAAMWAEALTPEFFRTSEPWQPNQQ